MRLETAICESIGALPQDEWNALRGADHPFLRHEFLAALERHDCVGGSTGWNPRHAIVTDGGVLVAAMPLYLKTHSWGEFVFDWGWAQAYARAGFDYYPKLVSTVPFTPAGTARFLARSGYERDIVAPRLLGAALEDARALGASSLHLLFVDTPDRDLLRDAGFLMRKDCQFHWHNRGYGDFEDFLAGFSSAKRKKVRRERRRVAEAGIDFEALDGGAIGLALWQDIYRFCASTFTRRGHLPYLTPGFFAEVGRTLADRIVVILARLHRRPVAAAICFRSADTLYGRYWGSASDQHSLHFETCYYQGIELCIRERLARFEPGTQGEHKISRGFTPVETWSAHWLAHPDFADALRSFVGRERRRVDAYIAAVHEHSPYRSTGDESRAARRT
ncbi:MAG: GNAT family N-acetyltransferase [Gammaproteobacteria bacterium]